MILPRLARLAPVPAGYLLAAALLRGNQPAATTPAALKLMSLEQLSSIEVTTPSKEPQSAMKAPVAIYVITGEDIRRSGATCIPEALRMAPGVEVARIDSSRWSIGIRGFGSRLARSLLVLIDGRTVYTTLFAGTYWEVQDTYMPDIDRIEVIRGPGGTIWGPNAVQGVINVITKSATDTQGASASAIGGNYEQGTAGFRYGGETGGDFHYRFYAKGFTRGPEYHPDRQNFDDWRSAQGGFRADWQRDANNSFTFQGDIYSEKAGERVGAGSYTPPYAQVLQGNELVSGGNVLARWTHTGSNGSNTQVQIYYDRTNHGELNVADYRNTFDADFIQRLNAPGRQHISWGLSGRYVGIYNPVVVTGVQFLPVKRSDWLATGFLQDEIQVIPERLTFTLGTKLLRTNFTGVAPEPSGRVAWTPSDKSTLWASYTHALRTPSDGEENFYLASYINTAPSGLMTFARFNPNTSFAPEQLNGYEAGYRRLLRQNLYVDVASFMNRYHNLFSEEFAGPAYLETDFAPLHLLIPLQFRNGLYGKTAGYEISPEWRPKEGWRLRGSWSYLQMHLHPAPGSGDLGTWPTIEGSSPRNQIELESDYDVSKTVQFDVQYRFISALPAEKVAAYSSMDARLGWRIRPAVDVSLVGQNLLQPWHVESDGDVNTLVGIGRSGYIRLTWMH